MKKVTPPAVHFTDCFCRSAQVALRADCVVVSADALGRVALAVPHLQHLAAGVRLGLAAGAPVPADDRRIALAHRSVSIQARRAYAPPGASRRTWSADRPPLESKAPSCLSWPGLRGD